MRQRQHLREAAAPVGLAAGALAVCCTVTLIIAAGGVGAATGVLGGWLRNPYVIAVGLALVAAAVAAFVIGRSRRRGGDR